VVVYYGLEGVHCRRALDGAGGWVHIHLLVNSRHIRLSLDGRTSVLLSPVVGKRQISLSSGSLLLYALIYNPVY
jgi:hypothetical protein